ncbi:hypothetical protein CF319_g9149 [Tilletia indica]|nr:hypothetical protein CF319_g9149 [Tilletia indica]
MSSSANTFPTANQQTYGVHVFNLASGNFNLPLDVDPIHCAVTSSVMEYEDEIFNAVTTLGRVGSSELYAVPSRSEWLRRVRVFEWLMQVHERCDMAMDTLWLAINICNRYLALPSLGNPDYFAVGLSSLCLAGKFEEDRHPKYRTLVRFMDGTIGTRAELLRTERSIFTALHYNIGQYVSPPLCLWHIAMVDDNSMDARSYAKVVLESTITEVDFIRTPPFTLAAAALYVGVKMYGAHWHSNYITRCGFQEPDLLPTANFILRVLRSDDYESSFVYQKYCGISYSFLTPRLRTWARSHTL